MALAPFLKIFVGFQAGAERAEGKGDLPLSWGLKLMEE